MSYVEFEAAWPDAIETPIVDGPSNGRHHFSGMGKLRWYVLHINEQLDVLVLKWLNWLGVEAYQFTETIKRARKTAVTRSMMPGYLFVKVDVTCSVWRTLHEIPGVVRLISSSAETPIPLPDGLLEALIKHHVAQPVRRPAAQPDPKVGEHRMILGGPFTSFNALIASYNADTRVAEVFVEIFGRSSQASMRREMLGEAIGRPAQARGGDVRR